MPDNLHVVTGIRTAGSIHINDGSVDAAAASRKSWAQTTAQRRMNDFAAADRDAHIAVGAEPDVAEQAARRAEEANREMWALPN